MIFKVSRTMYIDGINKIKPIIFINKSVSWFPVFNNINFIPIKLKIADNINKKNSTITLIYYWFFIKQNNIQLGTKYKIISIYYS